jgi:hypothetical protein
MKATSAFASALRGSKKVRIATSHRGLDMHRYVPNRGWITRKRLLQKRKSD